MAIALIQILLLLLTVLWWIIIIQVVISLLIMFNVINTQNDFMRQVYSALDRLTEPLYRPIRRILPDFGGLDFSPMIVLLLIGAVDMLLRGVARDLVLAGY